MEGGDHVQRTALVAPVSSREPDRTRTGDVRATTDGEPGGGAVGGGAGRAARRQRPPPTSSRRLTLPAGARRASPERALGWPAGRERRRFRLSRHAWRGRDNPFVRRNAHSTTEHFRLPAGRVMELGSRVEL